MTTLAEIEAAADKLTLVEKEHLFTRLKGQLGEELTLDESSFKGGTLGDLLRIWKSPDPEFANDLEKVNNSDTPFENPWD